MHLSPILIDAVLRGTLPRRLLDEIGHDHLETICPVCAPGLAALAAGAAAGPSPEPCPDPVEAVRRHLSLTERQLRDEEATARAWLKRLLRRVPAAARCRAVRGAYKRYRGPLFGTLLLEEARRAIPDDPAESLSLAEAALVSCEMTHPSDPDPQIRVPALAVRGNAKRALGRLREAEADLLAAGRLLDRSDLDDLAIAAEIDFYMGSLRKDQSRLEDAARHLERAAALYPLVGDREKAASTFLKLGTVHYRRHELEAAVEAVDRALGLLDADSDSSLRASARYNLAFYFHARGEIDRAELELAAYEDLLTAGGAWLALHVTWLRARIAWSRGDLRAAARLYTEARGRALERGVPFDAGLIALELALIHLVQGRTVQVKKLATEALRVFAEQDVERETRAALDLLEAAARRDALTRELVERAIAALEGARPVRPAPGREPS